MKPANVTAYQSYLLRLWCEKDKDNWRASLEDVVSHEHYNFSSLKALFDYIEGRANPQTSNVIQFERDIRQIPETRRPIFVEHSKEEVADN
jgi:hypothetical protein